jgi:universal stress protein E
MSSSSWQSILVAVRDPGQRKQLAIRKAAGLAAASGARVTLFHAFSAPYPLPVPMPTDPNEILRRVGEQRRAQLLALARPLRAAGLKVRCEVAWDFPPAHAIVRRVLAGRPDLVVAESHRHTRLARWFLANADWDLIRECPCPVWFVKSERLARKPHVLVAVDPTHARARPSGLDDRLLQAANSVAQQVGGSISLIHVRDTRQALVPAFPALPRDARAEPAAVRAATEAEVNRLARRNGLAAAPRVLEAGVPAEVLPQSAAELGAAVLVMGSVSRSAVGQMFIGNTAEAVIDAVTCDVLVVKPRQFRTAVPRTRPRLPGGVTPPTTRRLRTILDWK